MGIQGLGPEPSKLWERVEVEVWAQGMAGCGLLPLDGIWIGGVPQAVAHEVEAQDGYEHEWPR